MSTEAAAATVTRPADVGLKRDMGLIGATWASETSIIGSGWLFGSYFAAVAIGPAAIIDWLIGGAVVAILALVHAELGGMYPVAGGTARFPHFAFGSITGISFGFFSWLQAVTVAPIECFAVMQYGQYWFNAHHFYIFNATSLLVTGPGFILTIILMAVFTGINFLAMRLFTHVNSAITWWKVAIPVLTIIVLLFYWHHGNFSAGGGFIPKGVGWRDIFTALPASGIVFAYLGFEQADQLAGEIKNPQKNLPRAIILAMTIGTIIYVMLQVVFIAAMKPSLLTHGFAGLTCPTAKGAHCATAISTIVSGPFAGVAGALGLGALAIILYLDAFISPFGTGLMYQTSTSRIGYGLGRNRYYPPFFQWVDRNGIPWISLIFAFLLGLVFLLPFPSWHSLVSLVTGASVLMYAGAPLSLGAFRRQVPEAERPYRMPGAVWLSPLAFILANMIIYWSGFETIWKLGICIAIGYVLVGAWLVYAKLNMPDALPPLDRQNWISALWLPFYLLGMGIISWQGQFGPDNTFRIPFWYDMLIVAVFSLVIYYWAQYLKLPRHEMEKIVGQQSGAPDPGVH
jgi:amino acid transporter